MTSQNSPAVPIRSLNASASLSISDVNLMEAGAKTMSLRDLTGDTTNESTDVDYSAVANVSFPPTEELHAGSQRSGRKQRRTLLLIAAGLLCAALLVGLGVGLAVHHSSSPGSKEAQTHDQVPATLEEVVAYLVAENVSRESDLTNDKTPQYKAAQWISQVDGARLALPTTSLSSQDNRDAYLFVARYVLALTYFTLNGPNWNFQRGFLTDNSICDWNEPTIGIEGNIPDLESGGIRCSNETGLPIVMDLELNNATGTLPTETGLLTSLQYLDLDYNSVGGNFPTELCNLSGLQVLLLKGNTFWGELPSCVANWKDIKVIDLILNQFTGEIPASPGVCAFEGLQSLTLDKNYFYGSIPSCVSDFPNLTLLSISDNSLSGDIPDLSPLANHLQELYLDGNEFRVDPISNINQLKNLTRLYLEGNKFIGDIEDFAKDMNSLVALDLSSNLFTSSSGYAVPSHLFELPSLQVLDLSDNNLQGKIPESVPTPNLLVFLAVFKNQVTGTIPASLRNLTSLLHLDLAENDLTGPIPSEVFQMPNLNQIFLSENTGLEAGPIPSDISAMTQLSEVSLQNTNRNGPLPELLGFDSLFLLALDKNKLTGTIPSNYGTLTLLRHLLLNGNPLSGPVPTFADTQNLGTVLVDGTNITGNLSSICDLPGFTGEVDLATDIIAIADCAGSNPMIECSCCYCCNKAGGCSDPAVASLDWTWENGFTRTSRDFSIDTSILQPPKDPPAGD